MPFLMTSDCLAEYNHLRFFNAYNEYEPQRVILHFNIDCFEVQLWMQELRPDLIGKDVPVVVINSDQIILSVNYTAKSLGVKRGKHRALKEAHALCRKAGTKLVEITAGESYGKVDSFFPVTESDRILGVIDKWVADFNKCKNPYLPIPIPIKIERTSRDEFYIDVTGLVDAKIKYYKKASGKSDFLCIPKESEIKVLNLPKYHPNGKYNGQPRTIMEGQFKRISGDGLSYRVQTVYPLIVNMDNKNELRLIHGALIANKLINLIEVDAKYQVSAGVAHSKLVAKLACGLNKPNGISIIADGAFPRLQKKFVLQDLPGFGGIIGDAVQIILHVKSGVKIEYISDILEVTTNGFDLGSVFKELEFLDSETKAQDLHNKCMLNDESQVTCKVYPDTISTQLSFEDCRRKDEFDDGLWNIARDMKRRISYYKDMGRIAQDLVIKADYISHRGRERDHYNVFSLPVKKNDFVRCSFIYDCIVDYIDGNWLRWEKILKIHLTARNIKSNK